MVVDEKLPDPEQCENYLYLTFGKQILLLTFNTKICPSNDESIMVHD